MYLTDEESYQDDKGRTRWRCNDQIGEMLKQLGEFLIIAGYEESHATRYAKLAYQISRHPESILTMAREDRLAKLPGIGITITGIVEEMIATGTCTKMEEFTQFAPKTVLELTEIPSLGAKMVKTLYQEHGIDSLATLKHALDAGRLECVKGLGQKTLATMREYVAQQTG